VVKKSLGKKLNDSFDLGLLFKGNLNIFQRNAMPEHIKLDIKFGIQSIFIVQFLFKDVGELKPFTCFKIGFIRFYLSLVSRPRDLKNIETIYDRKKTERKHRSSQLGRRKFQEK